MTGVQTCALPIFGNVVSSYNVEFLLQEYPDVLVAIGLGEEAMEGIVKYAHGVIEKSNIPNIAYKFNDSIIITEKRGNKPSHITIPEQILKSVVQSGGIMYMETSRGCPFNCKICSRKEFIRGGWQSANIDNIVKDVIEVCKYGVKNINFVDEDLFAGGTKRLVEFADKIIKAKYKGLIPKDLIFGTSTSVRHIYDQNLSHIKNEQNLEAFKRLYNAGLRILFIGIESGSATQLKRYGKAATIKENERAIELIESLNITVIPGFIMFDPLVTTDELLENINFLRRTGMDTRITYPLKSYIPLRESAYTNYLISIGLVDSNSYIPERIAYDNYYYTERKVADALSYIKDWEESQAMFFWELKIIFRSSKFGEVANQEKRIIRRYIDEQTKILLDYLEVVIKLPEKEFYDKDIINKISIFFGHRLLNDMIENLKSLKNGKMTLGGIRFLSVIYKSIVRELIRLYFSSKPFTVRNITCELNNRFGYKIPENIIKHILSSLERENRITIEDLDKQQYTITNSFWKFRNIPWADLPRPYKILQKECENKQNFTDLRLFPNKFSDKNSLRAINAVIN